MKVTRFDADPDLRLSDTSGDRAPGLHLSDVIKTMQFERDKKFDPNRPLDMMLLEQGHTWEEVLAHAIQRRWHAANPDYAGYRPDPIHFDGVHMSPDWFQPLGLHAAFNGKRGPVVEEWKATKTSKNKVLEDHQWYWLVQVLGYLKGMSHHLQTPIRHARFRVWYINGDYSWDAKGSDMTLLRDYVRYDVEFTQREIDENWRKLIGQAKKHGLLEQEPAIEKTEDEWQNPRSRKDPTRSKSSSQPVTSAPAAATVTSPSSRTPLRPRRDS